MQHSDTEIRVPGLRSTIVWLAAFSVVANVLLLIMPLYMTQVYDRILPSRSGETLVYLTLIAVAGLMLFGWVETIRQIIAQKMSIRYELAVLPIIIDAASAGVASADATAPAKAATVKRFLASGAFTNLFDLPFAPLFLALMFLANAVLGWVTVAGMVLLVIVTFLNQFFAGRHSAENAAAQARAGRFSTDAVRQMENVRAMGMGQAMTHRWRAAALTSALTGDRIAGVNAGFFGLVRFTRQSIQMLVLGAGAWLVIHGDMSASLIFAASIVSSRALLPVEQLVGAWRQIAEARQANSDIRRIVSAATASKGARRLTLPEPRGLLQTAKLTYTIGKTADAPVLVREVDLSVQPGEIAVIVGASGSGKSTLARLLVGALDASFGDIRLDGFSLGQWPDPQRARSIGYMAQQSVLFEGTLAQNIARFETSATDEDIVAAAKASEAHDFVATLPQGYNTPVGPGGVQLSGGQMQRVALARALFRRPQVLVLDEPNAHLDRSGEDALMRVLAAERDAGRTIVIISHRSAVLSIASAVYLMDRGRLGPLPVSQIQKNQTRPAERGPLLTMAGGTAAAFQSGMGEH